MTTELNAYGSSVERLSSQQSARATERSAILCRTLTVVATLAIGLSTASAGAADWPQFLGPERTGISTETGLIKSWPQGGPKEVWRQKCGEGMAGMAIADGRLITMYQTTDGQHCVAYSATTGERQWQTTVARYYKNQMGNGPRATPLIAGNHVFVFTGDGILACLQTVDGKEVWKEDCMARFKSKVADYGMASSPVIAGNNVVVTVGASSATVAAFDAKSGKLAWTSGSGAAAGYSSPAVRKVADHDELLVFHGGGAAGLDPATGQQIWSYPYKTDYDCNIATPIVTPSGVLISAGENHGSVMLKVGTKTSSRPSAVWESVGVKSVLRSEWQTPILLNGYIYGMDNVGSAGPVTNLACVEARSGKQVWLKRRFGKGNLIAADGLLVISTMKGELVLVEASPEGFKELGRGNYVGQTRQAPALSNGMVYLRDDADIVCLDLRAQK